MRLGGSGSPGPGRGEGRHGDTRVLPGVHCSECVSLTLSGSLMLFACGHVGACFGAGGSVQQLGSGHSVTATSLSSAGTEGSGLLSRWPSRLCSPRSG